MIRRFEVSVSCSSCARKIEKLFKNYKDIKYSLNIIEKILVIDADEKKYSNEFIIELLKGIGYIVKEI